MGQAAGWTVVEEPKPQTAPEGWTPVAETHFQTENEKDAEGNAVVDPNTIGTFARHVGRQVNPLPLGQMIPFPQAAGGAGWDAPYKAASGILEAQKNVKAKADEAWKRGDVVGAAAHYLYWLMPVIGPVLDQAGEDFKNGKYAAGLGDTLGLSASLLGAKALEQMPRKAITVKPSGPSNPAEAAAVQFGRERGIPLDAATATGNKFVAATQALAEHSPIGSVVDARARTAQAAGLTRVAGELADEAHPVPVTPETAGAGIKSDVTGLVQDLHKQASEAYGRLRAMEADPANAGEVPAPPPSAAVQVRMADSVGAVPTKSELSELRRIREELDNQRYKAGKLMDNTPGENDGSHYDPRSGNADVYHDIREAAPGTSEMSGREMVAAIDRALETGTFTNAAKGALAVARERLATPGGRAARSATLPPGAGDLPMRRMVMPVDLTSVKAGLRPLYDRLLRKKELTGVLMGDEGRALTAIDALISGPDHAPVSVVDAALGDIKAMARGAAMPELRTGGQASAAQAVDQLGKAVFEAVDRVGPEARSALEEGRSATTAKYVVADLLDEIKAEPVGAYRKAVAPKDTAIEHLRRIRENSPESMSRIGRAFLEELFGRATAEGGFQRAAGLQADWAKLGPETKQMLYGPKLTKSLDDFFLLAKRLEINPNTSKSTLVAASGHFWLSLTHPVTGIPIMLGSGALAKILHSQKAIDLLLQGLRTEVGPGQRSVTAAKMARANVVAAAKAAGVDLSALPKAAQSPAQETTR